MVHFVRSKFFRKKVNWLKIALIASFYYTTMISVRIKAEIWWGKHGNLVSLTKQVIVSQHVKLIREEKHQEYLLNTGCKLLSSENTKNNENTK